MNAYKPGQSFRVTMTCKVLGVLTDPSSPTATMFLPDRTSTAAAPVTDSQGVAHADFVIPMGTPKGIGTYRCQTTGSQPDQCSLKERQFEVLALDF